MMGSREGKQMGLPENFHRIAVIQNFLKKISRLELLLKIKSFDRKHNVETNGVYNLSKRM